MHIKIPSPLPPFPVRSGKQAAKTKKITSKAGCKQNLTTLDDVQFVLANVTVASGPLLSFPWPRNAYKLFEKKERMTREVEKEDEEQE